MKINGKKLTCIHCGTKFYNLNKLNTNCPNCKKAYTFNTVERKKINKKIKLDLFFIDKEKNTEVITLQSKLVKFSNITDLQNGWYIIAKNSFQDGIIDNINDLIWLNTPPLNGLQQVLSGYRFPGVGTEISKKIIESPNFTFSLLRKSSKVISESLNLSAQISRAISTGWTIKTNEIILEIIFRELKFTGTQIQFINDNIGTNIFHILHKNPSDLLGNIPRITFEQLNLIYKRLNLKPTEKEFAIAATRFWLAKTEDRRGHTCAPEAKVIKDSYINLKNLK
tara:strand:+ start:125 stop:967 length:843 start_codon:yes stop_codon:yes gene_type:complete